MQAAATSVFKNKSLICCQFPAPPNAKKGHLTSLLNSFRIFKSYPNKLPSKSILLIRISPAPLDKERCIAFLGSKPKLFVPLLSNTLYSLFIFLISIL